MSIVSDSEGGPWSHISTFSSSIARLALARSSAAMRATSSSSSENFRFSPRFSPPFDSGVADGGCDSLLRGVAAFDVALRPLLTSNPACVSSNSRMALSSASASWRAFSSKVSLSCCSLAFSSLLISFFWARMLLSAHSRQYMSPCRQDTGSIAVSRHRRHDANGRKESRFRRADEELQAAFARARSCEVKTARLVFLLPAWSEGSWS